MNITDWRDELHAEINKTLASRAILRLTDCAFKDFPLNFVVSIIRGKGWGPLRFPQGSLKQYIEDYSGKLLLYISGDRFSKRYSGNPAK